MKKQFKSASDRLRDAVYEASYNSKSASEVERGVWTDDVLPSDDLAKRWLVDACPANVGAVLRELDMSRHLLAETQSEQMRLSLANQQIRILMLKIDMIKDILRKKINNLVSDLPRSEKTGVLRCCVRKTISWLVETDIDELFVDDAIQSIRDWFECGGMLALADHSKSSTDLNDKTLFKVECDYITAVVYYDNGLMVAYLFNIVE